MSSTSRSNLRRSYAQISGSSLDPGRPGVLQRRGRRGQYSHTPAPPPPTHGILDATFGSKGAVITAIGTSDDEINALKLQSDGKIVAAGQSQVSSGVNQFVLVRYNTDGSLDTTFGTGGIVTTKVGTGDCMADALVIQGDKKLVAAGYASIGSANQFALVRYNPDGSLDTTFGAGGIVTTAMPGTDNEILDLGLQGDGKLVAVGYQGTTATWYNALARFNPDGSTDTTFGVNGFVTTNLGLASWWWRLVIQGDGKLAVAGPIVDVSSWTWEFGLARYNTDGSLDTTFSAGETAVGGYDSEPWALTLQADGKFLAAGYANTICSCDLNTASDYRSAPSNFALVRYTAGGNLDTGFGTDGIVTPNGPGFFHFNDLALQTDGSVLSAGASGTAYSSRQATLARLTPAGAVDTTFGTSGFTVSPLGADSSGLWRMAVQSDGNLVCGGLSTSGGVTKFLVARYIP
ncbi:MAG: hypothetical protein ABSH53_25040 [Holophaga sp.]